MRFSVEVINDNYWDEEAVGKAREMSKSIRPGKSNKQQRRRGGRDTLLSKNSV